MLIGSLLGCVCVEREGACVSFPTGKFYVRMCQLEISLHESTAYTYYGCCLEGWSFTSKWYSLSSGHKVPEKEYRASYDHFRICIQKEVHGVRSFKKFCKVTRKKLYLVRSVCLCTCHIQWYSWWNDAHQFYGRTVSLTLSMSVVINKTSCLCICVCLSHCVKY